MNALAQNQRWIGTEEYLKRELLSHGSRRFRFAIAGGSKEGPAPDRSDDVSLNCSRSKTMQKTLGLLTNHWLAKLLSLFLAVTLWAVIKSNVKGTTSLSRIQLDNTKPSADGKFDIGSSIHGDRKK